MRLRALLLAVFSFLLFASPLSAQVVAGQCALDKTVTDGGQTFNQCPFGAALNFLTAQGYNGARLDPDIDLSRTPLNLYSTAQCRYVDARGTESSLFIPFNSADEWAAFIGNVPTGVHTANCCQPRPLVVGDVPPITAVPNVPACASGWVFDGLADPSNFNNLLATPSGTAANSGFTLAAGVTEDPNYPITGLPIERDDIRAQLPTGARASQPYVARYRCVTTTGDTTNTQIQLIQFALQCTASNWAYTGSGCIGGTIALFNDPCPNGGSGSVTKQVTRACPSGEVTVQTLSNTCTAACVPGQVGSSFTAACPAGQTGAITRAQFRQCPSGNLVTQDVSNTCSSGTCTPPTNICPTGSTPTCTSTNGQCSCTCSGNCPTGQTDLGIATTQCPSGQNGVIQTHSFRSCTNTNNQCVCNLAATEEDNCSTGATCTPTTPATCPSGQVSVCTPSGPGGQCTCLCAPDDGSVCLPRTVTTQMQVCPSGQTGLITLTHTKICSSTQSGGSVDTGNGCFCTTTTTTANTCTTPVTCVPSTDLGNSNRSCPGGQVGTVVINTKRICSVTNSQCVCHNEETEVTRACETVQCTASTDLGNTTQNCPAGQTGQIVINTRKTCSLSVGCTQTSCPPAICNCSNIQSTVSNTCTPVVCTPSTDMGNQTLACPAPQTGAGISVHVIRECTASNNQCVCVSRYQVLNVSCSGTAQCVPSTDLGTKTLQCPSGQSGEIKVQRVKTCTPCDGGQCLCSVQEIPISNTCVASCTPSARTVTEQCPAGSTGSIVKTISHLCDCVGGRDVVTNVTDTCVAIQQCVTSSHTENLGCPDGFSGSRTRTTTHVCDCPGGRDVVTENNTCTCQTPCVPDTLMGTSSQSCGNNGHWNWHRGSYGSITVEHHRVCTSRHGQCVCHNEDRTVGGDCTPTVFLPPDIGHPPSFAPPHLPGT